MKPPIDTTSLDAKLSAEDQQRVRQTVRALKEELPSLAWRSQLNERVMAESIKRHSRQRLWWIFTPSIGFAVSGALAFVILFRGPSHSIHRELPQAAVSSSSLEDSIAGIASDSAISDDVTGSGLHVRDLPSDDDDSNSEDATDL